MTPSGGYTLLKQLGGGQAGEVFRALAPGGVPVAVKRIMRPLGDEASQREHQSLELIKSLRHTYLLQTHAYWVEDGRLHIAMELADGSLHDWFQEYQQKGLPGIPAGELLTYMAEAAEAIDFLHSQRVLHRDIKPANLLHLKGHAKVADFGLARLFEGDLATATFCGTPLYMAPEVWKGQIAPASDQYSLAATFAEMCSGQRIYTSSNMFALGQQHAESLPNLEGFTDAEREVLARALAKDPSQRYASCVEFIRTLTRAHAPPPLPPPIQTRLSPGRRLLRTTLWVAIVAVQTILLLAVGMRVAQALRPPGPAPEAWLPEGFVPAEGATVRGHYYDRLLCSNLEGADPMEFLLVPWGTEKDPPTFYIMRDKVTFQQFQAAAAVRARKGLIEKLKAGGHPEQAALLEDNAGKRQEYLRNPACARRPVVYVLAAEAHAFAELLGGKLPSEKQWDKAGGRFDGQPGPFKPGWKPRKRELTPPGPAPVGDDEQDESFCGCRGMGANGREFTRDIHRRRDLEVPLPAPNWKYRVILRGISSDTEEAFRFDRLDDGADYAPARPYDEAGYDLTFRVVLEPPPK
jgi:formylglycine-generating enzyme required for sulfatase activity